MKWFAPVLGVALMASPPQGAQAARMFAVTQDWGSATGGLRVGISAVASGRQSPIGAEFYVAFENTGNSDFIVNLGLMLANGKSMFPTRLGLVLTDPAGRIRELAFPTPRIRGRVDDFMVPLPSNSTYRVLVSLRAYRSPATEEYGLTLADGKYRIAARLDGQGANWISGDMKGVALLNFWKGTVQSNTFEFEVLK